MVIQLATAFTETPGGDGARHLERAPLVRELTRKHSQPPSIISARKGNSRARRPRSKRWACRQRGALTTDLIIAMGILVTVLIPIAFAITHQQKLCREAYYRAVAMEVVDGEAEVLAAGEWRAFKEGAQPYTVHAESAKNLPKGRFELTRQAKLVRLEWVPEGKSARFRVVREFTVK